MAIKPATPRRGNGRAAFIARLSTIRAEIAAGEYLATVHQRHKEALGITYSAFRKLVQRYADDSKPLRKPAFDRLSSASPATPPKPATPQPDLPLASSPTSTEGPAHARHEPTARPRTFNYDGNPKQDDKARLIGRREPKD